MIPETEREDLRGTLAAFDDRQKKIVGGVVTVMIGNPHRVRDREWIAEQFAQVTLLASGFEDVSSAQDGLAQIQGYVQENVNPILNACFRLFQCVADDIAAGGGAQDMDRADAVELALGYLAEAPE